MKGKAKKDSNLAEGGITPVTVTVTSGTTARTMGGQDALVILFNFSNDRSQPYSPDSAASVTSQVRDFYLENSFGQTIMNFTVTGWLTIPATNAGCDYYTWATQAETAASNAGFNLNAYDRRILAFPAGTGCTWWGMGNLAGPRSWVNGSFALRVVAHEQGHNFGNHHSHSMPCNAGSCGSVEYGDDRDVLGTPGTVGHMNAFQKERLGWLNYGSSPTIQTVTSSNDYWIQNYEVITGDPRALKIWNSKTGTYYYVESRANTGFDAGVPSGVTLHTGSPSVANSSYQVDLAPESSDWDSTLDPGQVFRDSAIGVEIETLSTGLDGALIRVIFGGAPAPAPGARTCTRARACTCACTRACACDVHAGCAVGIAVNDLTAQLHSHREGQQERRLHCDEYQSLSFRRERVGGLILSGIVFVGNAWCDRFIGAHAHSAGRRVGFVPIQCQCGRCVFRLHRYGIGFSHADASDVARGLDGGLDDAGSQRQ